MIHKKYSSRKVILLAKEEGKGDDRLIWPWYSDFPSPCEMAEGNISNEVIYDLK